MWLHGRDELEKSGFQQYEVSNFAKPGYESKHNQGYWRMENYLGFGPGAVGTIVDEVQSTARRITVPKNVDAWLAGSPEGIVFAEHITRDDFIAECLIMGFRTVAGVDDSQLIKRFGVDTRIFIPQSLMVWRKRGLAELDRPALTREGLLFLNRFLIDCLTELGTTRTHYVR
jgi:oxygen-independent coproporphyrinogen-3 oxidase